MPKPLAIPPGDWPEADKHLWQQAITPGDLFDPPRPAAEWSRARRRIVAQTYGQWLRFCRDNGYLDEAVSPASRASADRLIAFLSELHERVSSESFAMMAGALKRALDVMIPSGDWAFLRSICRHGKTIAHSERPRFEHAVTADDLLTLGFHLMARANEIDRPDRQALLYRDGLMIALLICCPLRMRNFSDLRIGETLKFSDPGYLIEFPAASTKTKQSAISQPVPDFLTRSIDTYLKHFRPVLVGRDSTGHEKWLWMNRFRSRLKEAGIREQVKAHTAEAFGRHVWPHLFRHCAATSVVDVAPEKIAIASDLLGHRTTSTTGTYYVLARGMTAHTAVANHIRRLRSS